MIYIEGLNKIISEESIYLFIVTIFFFLIKLKKINKNEFIILSIYSLTPILINVHIVDATNMWDQVRYSRKLLEYEYQSNFFEVIKDFNLLKVNFFSYLYSLFPFLYKGSINTIALINKFILIITLLFLYSKKKLSYYDVAIILFLPATIFYTSFSLKESMILSITLLITFSFFEKKFFLIFIFIIILFILRFQYAVFVCFYFFIFFIRKEIIKVTKYNLFHIFFIILAVVFLFLNLELVINPIYKVKFTYFVENLGWKSYRTSEYNRNFFAMNKMDLIILLNYFKFNLTELIFLEGKVKIFLLTEIFIFILLTLFLLIDKKNNYLKYFNVTIFFIPIILVFFVVENYLSIHRYSYNFMLFYFIVTRYNFKNNKKLL